MFDNDFFIVATYPYHFSWNYELSCDNDINNICTFNIIDKYLIRINDYKYLYFNGTELIFSDDNRTEIILEKTTIKTNFRIKIGNKYIRHQNLFLKCHIDDNSELFLSDSTWIFIQNTINNDHEIIISRYHIIFLLIKVMIFYLDLYIMKILQHLLII